MSDHGARALVVAALTLLAVGGLLWWLASRPSDVDALLSAVAAAEPGELVRVDEVLTEDWEELHVFAPHTPPDRVEAAVGRRVGAVRGLVREEVMLLVFTDQRGRVVASGLAARFPVDWLPLAEGAPYEPAEAVFRIEVTADGKELREEGAPDAG